MSTLVVIFLLLMFEAAKRVTAHKIEKKKKKKKKWIISIPTEKFFFVQLNQSIINNYLNWILWSRKI